MTDRSAVARKAWQTRRRHGVVITIRDKERASKVALEDYCKIHGWRVAFFEGPTGAPRTGIIDAVMFRIDKHNADLLDLRLVQLKGGKAGVSGAEIARLKRAAADARVTWLIAAYDGEVLHMVPDPDTL